MIVCGYSKTYITLECNKAARLKLGAIFNLEIVVRRWAARILFKTWGKEGKERGVRWCYGR